MSFTCHYTYLNLSFFRAQAKKQKTGGSAPNIETSEVEEIDASIHDILTEPAGAFTDPLESIVMDNIPDVQVNPPKTDDVTMDPSQKENINSPSPLKSSKYAMFEKDVVVIMGRVTRHPSVKC